jgi:soluble lytic murein transglycosylase
MRRSLLSLILVVVWSTPAFLIAQQVPRELHLLAFQARAKRGWAPLRRYARQERNREARGLAYFVLGYREYQANAFDGARLDLHLAAETRCTVTDLAGYYEALADQQLKRNAEGIGVLTDFLQRYPQSAFHVQAAALLANLLVQADQATQAIQVLEGTPGARRDPASLLAFAKAYQAERNERQAATIYQEIYYDFPLAPPAREAGTALNGLRLSMGAAYPQVSGKREAARAAKLFDGSDYQRAFRAYSALREKYPDSQAADQWQLDRARCLLRLGRYDEAAEILLSPMRDNQTADSERLRLLVHIYERAGDEPSMLNALNELFRQYPSSSSYADALFFAGGYFSRHGFWQTAAPYYQRLAQSFPTTHWAPQAEWWVTWFNVLEGKNQEAISGLDSYIQKYPKSFHIPAALYWLARIKQEQGLTVQAQALYRAVTVRFPSTYYGLKARNEAGIHLNRRSAMADGPSPIAVAAGLEITLAPTAPPIADLSESASLDESLRPALTLAQLGLRSLANQVLPQAIRGLPRNPDLFFALARLQSEQNEPALALFAARSAVPNYRDYSFDGLPEEEWKLLYPRPYWNLVHLYARLERLNPYLVMALIRQESAFDPQATSVAGARGLMQMRPGTAAAGIRSRWRRRRVGRLLYNPRYNIRVSCRYFRDLLVEFGGNLEEAIAAYNAGDFRVKEWLANGKYRDSDEFVESIPFTETRVYVESVMRDAAIYRSILTGRARFSSRRLREN